MTEYVLLLILLLLVFVLAVGAVGFFFYVKIARKSKGVERSLKMVPLLVKIPPQEVSGDRDVREVIKENISKAEGIFRLLSGISTKRSQIYGQRYVSFEIIADGNQIFFYVAVPASLVTAVKKALASGYPGVQIEQKEDVNFFSKTSKISGVAGGEFELKKSSYYPINNYQMSEQDALAGVLSGLSNLGDHEGAAIQLLIRPADSKWAKGARTAAKQVLDPNKKEGFNKVLDFVGELLRAPFKAPDENGGSSPKENKTT